LIWSHVQAIDQGDNIATPSHPGCRAITRHLNGRQGGNERGNGRKRGCKGRRVV
jgi:hypothetical protein